MKKYLKYSLFLMALVCFNACSNDDSKPEEVTEEVKDPAIEIKLASGFETEQYNVIEIAPEVAIENGKEKKTTYKWSVKVSGTDGAVKDSIIGESQNLLFIASKAAEYTLDFTVTVDKVVKQASTKVAVGSTGKTYERKALTIVDYMPAPGHNLESFTSKQEALEMLQENFQYGGSASLGTFGGYIVMAFDHTVLNVYGKRDFTVQMSTGNSTVKYSPVSIMAAYDANKNGKADADEWYEIAGSEYHKSTTVKNYEITYRRPNPDASPTAGEAAWQYDTAYLPWTDNKNGSGSITKTNNGRWNTYYPEWITDTYTLKGTKVAIQVKDVSDGAGTAFNVGTFEWGYGGIKDPSIDISWAVDKDGKKVHLPGVDFVKVYVPTFAALGARDLLTSIFEEVSDLNFAE